MLARLYDARRWYRTAQERVLFLNHALVQPPVDRHRPPDEVADVYVHVERETDAGLIVSGAKVVATGSALTHANFIAHPTTTPIATKEFAAVFIATMDTPGVKLICRPSYAMAAEVMGSPFDYPLSSRLDENDAILVLDHARVPWEDVLVYEDVGKSNTFFQHSGFFPRAMLHGCTRLAVKLDFVTGLMLKAAEAVGSAGTRHIQTSIGEVIAWRNLFWGLTDAMARAAVPSAGGTGSTSAITPARPRRSDSSPGRWPRRAAWPGASRSSPNAAWPSTTSRAGRHPTSSRRPTRDASIGSTREPAAGEPAGRPRRGGARRRLRARERARPLDHRRHRRIQQGPHATLLAGARRAVRQAGRRHDRSADHRLELDRSAGQHDDPEQPAP